MPSFFHRAAARLRHRRDFDGLCRQAGLDLDYRANRDSVAVLREVFVQRRYADGFPFYQKATIVDVGAHKGYFALFAARHAAPGSRIVAAEPHPATAATLRDNLRRNGAGQVRVEAVAVAGSAGTAALHLDRSFSHSLHAVPGAASVEVPVTTLTALLGAHGIERVDFLKLDCEGAEYDILLDAAPETLARIHTLSLEFHDRRDARFTGQALARHLDAHGFQIVHFHHAPTTRDRNYGHLLALRGW